MPCSPAQLAANRSNASRSTGPRTPEGKAISRRNGLKHGLTGQGIALPDEDATEVERRFAEVEAELNPATAVGRALALRTAMLTVRLERCYRNEAARLTVAVDSAEKDHRNARLAEVQTLVDGLSADPALNAPLLQQTPEGVALTIEVWEDLRVDLMHPDRKIWSANHLERAENLMGRCPDDLPRSRIGALSRAMWYDFAALDPREASDLNDQGKYEYVRDRLAEIIDARIVTLSALLASFDAGAIARARSASTDRALFEVTPEAILARKYEAATERSLFRTLREFREVEAEAEVEAETPAAEAVAEELASSLPEPTEAIVPAPRPARPRDPKALRERSEAASKRDRGRNGPG